MPIRKVAALLLRYDYGIPARGISMERRLFVPSMKQVFDKVSCLWLEDCGYPNDIDGLQTKALEFVKQEQPDLAFFILMRDEIRPETLDRIRKVCPTANWFCDDQWRFEDFSSRLAPHLDWAITTDKFSVPKYEKLGGAKPILTQWAAESAISSEALEKIEYEFDVSFVGSANSTRRYYIDYLKKTGIGVECFGQGWPNGRVSPERMREIFLRSRVNLNLSNSVPEELAYARFLVKSSISAIFGLGLGEGKYRKRVSAAYYDLRELGSSQKSSEQIKARNFEIPSAGGFQLSHYALGLEDHFLIGKEIAVFTCRSELATQVRFYLDNEVIRESIRLGGYMRACECTYSFRFKKIRAAMESNQMATTLEAL